MSNIIHISDKSTALSASLLPPDIGAPERIIPMSPLYSGGKCFVPQYDVPAIVDIETLRFDVNPPNLVEHHPQAVAGQLVNLRKSVIDGKPVVCCEARVKGTTFAKLVCDYFDNKIAELKPSIGIGRTEQFNERRIGSGERATVNDVEQVGPAIVLYNGCVTEGSWVAMGGDEKARALLSAALATITPKGGDPMNFAEWLKSSKNMTEAEFEALSDEEKATIKSEFESSMTASEGSGDNSGSDALKEAAIEEIVNALEGKPTETVLDAYVALQGGSTEEPAATASAKRNTLTASLQSRIHLKEGRRQKAIELLCKERPDIAAKAIDGNWSLDHTEKVLTASMKKTEMQNKYNTPFVSSQVGLSDSGPKPQQILTASLAVHAGIHPDKIKATLGYSDDVLTAALSSKYRNATPRSVVAESANSFKPGTVGMNTNRLEAFSMATKFCRRFEDQKIFGEPALTAAMGFSTISATDAIFDTLKVSLLDQPATADHVYPQICVQNTVPDLNDVKGYDVDIIGDLREISSTGQIEHVDYEEGVIRYGTELKAATFVIPEQMFIQDGIGYFASLIQRFNALPEKSKEHAVAMVFQRILDGKIMTADDGKPFFTTDRGNLISGTDSILSGDGLAMAEMAMDDFKNRNGEPLSSAGAFLLVNSAQYATARRIFGSANINQEDMIGTTNIYSGAYRPLKWQYLNRNFAEATNQFFTKYGASFWLMMRDPNVRPLLAVTGLDGFSSPLFEQKEADASVWGRVYRVIYPYKVNPMYGDAAVLSLGKNVV